MKEWWPAPRGEESVDSLPPQALWGLGFHKAVHLLGLRWASSLS